jgi:hypothetical protein
MEELTAVRAEVEVAATVDAARAAAAEVEALCGSSTNSSVSADDSTDDELKLMREAAREQAAQWAAVHSQGNGGGSPDGRGCTGGASSGRPLQSCPRRRWQPRQVWLSLPRQVPWSPRDPGHCQGRRYRRWVAYTHQDQLRRVGRGDGDTALGVAHVGSSSVQRRRLL